MASSSVCVCVCWCLVCCSKVREEIFFRTKSYLRSCMRFLPHISEAARTFQWSSVWAKWQINQSNHIVLYSCVCVQSEDFFTNKALSPMRFNLPHISGAAKTKSILLTFSMLDKKWKGHQSQSYLHICSSLHAIAWCPITIVVWIWPWICPWVCPWIAPGLKSFNQSVYANHLKSICSMNT